MNKSNKKDNFNSDLTIKQSNTMTNLTITNKNSVMENMKSLSINKINKRNKQNPNLIYTSPPKSNNKNKKMNQTSISIKSIKNNQNINNINNNNNASYISDTKSDFSTLGKRIMSTKFIKKTDISKFTINDLNNYIGADRKLIVNSTYEFWIHDVLLISTSNYFKKILGEKEDLKNEKFNDEVDDVNYLKTYIEVPHPEYFFDVLAWIYSKNDDRLASQADDPDSFLSILNLGIYLELCDEFFNAILNNCDIQLDDKLIQYPQWSRFVFTFEVLVSLVGLMPYNNYLLKTASLLSWLKEDENLQGNSNEGIDINEREVELLTSKEFFMVKKYLKDNNFLGKLNISELNDIKNKYSMLIPALDVDFLIKKYFEESDIKIICKVCKRKANNIQEFINYPCEIKLYHPKNFAFLQRQLYPKCEHDDCNKKMCINEFPCCHKASHVPGCMLSDGNHILELY